MAAAAALLAIPAAEAQKVNKEATLSKLEKSDADIANPKKNAKAATWINRGRVYYDAAAEPTANLFAPMETTLLKLSVGDPTSTEEVTLNGSKAIAWNYPYFIAYERDGKIVAWKQLQEIKEGALDTAIEAYNKAYELDPKQASKIKNGLEQISNYASILGNVSIEAGEYLTGAEAYLAANDSAYLRCAVFACKDKDAAAAVKKLIQTYIDDSIDAKYNVDEVALLQNAKIHSMGNYVAVAVTSDTDNVNKVIDQYFA